MHPRFHSAFNLLPEPLKSAMHPVLEEDGFEALLTPEQIAVLRQKTGMESDALALALLPLAAACALAPLSRFNVGAIARGISGHWYFGANMEFIKTPMQQTVHAEQSAITHAWLRGETRLETITVNYTPCGHCRQFMNEMNSGTDIRISLPDRAVSTLADYLPDAFGPGDLAITERLMDQVNQGYLPEGDALTQAAIQAASASHAPYTQAHSGVALLSASGRIVSGRYAENAAFNPSLPPLQAALILLNMLGEDIQQIQRAVLAEAENACITQRDATFATLSALGCPVFDSVALRKA